MRVREYMLLGLLCLIGAISSSAMAASKYFVYLTWTEQDTATTMAINFQGPKVDWKKPTVHFDTVSRNGVVDAYKNKVSAKTKTLNPIKREIAFKTLRGLTPFTTYYFVVGDKKNGFTEEMKFRTLPNDPNQKIIFVTGGDMGTSSDAARILARSASQNPDLAIIGGDIAYANGLTKNWKRWDDWLKNYTENMIAPDGRLIPYIASIGNHEVSRSKLTKVRRAPFYFSYLNQEEGKATYFKRMIGSNSALYVLDSGHMKSHDGKQLKWLKAQMSGDQGLSYRFAVYHVPMYPSHRSYDGSRSKAGRKYWGPVFDQYKLTAGFENHDHVMKRTKQLFANKVNATKGTIYFGDGCYGRSPRVAEKRWYLEKSISVRHFWRGEISKDRIAMQGITDSGQVLDNYVIRKK